MSLIVKVGKAGKRVVKKFLPEEKHHVRYTRRIERVKTRERGGGHDLRRWSHGPALQPR